MTGEIDSLLRRSLDAAAEPVRQPPARCRPLQEAWYITLPLFLNNATPSSLGTPLTSDQDLLKQNDWNFSGRARFHQDYDHSLENHCSTRPRLPRCGILLERRAQFRIPTDLVCPLGARLLRFGLFAQEETPTKGR